jgi:hypothetical protein
LSLDAGLMLGGARDNPKNANDTAPKAPDDGSFICSEVGPWGAYFAPGLEYRWRRVLFGGEAQITGVPISSGWDRYSQDEEVASTFRWMVTGGPKIGVQLAEQLRLEGSIQFGKAIGGSVWLRFQF